MSDYKNTSNLKTYSCKSKKHIGKNMKSSMVPNWSRFNAARMRRPGCKIPTYPDIPTQLLDGSETSSARDEGKKTSLVVDQDDAMYGLISVIGRRRVMEDAVTVVPGLSVGCDLQPYDFFAVYDGHGGATVAEACCERMHQLIAMEIEELGMGKGQSYWEKIMGASFEKMDEEMNGIDEAVKEGATAVVVMVGEKEIVVANCGDSRVILCREGKAVPLSSDHKPDRPDEKKRIEEAGGRVVDWYGSRTCGVLAISRAIGDSYMKPYVISEPEVMVIERDRMDEFLVIASDGVWDAVSNDVACDIVKKSFEGRMMRKNSDEGTGSDAAEAATFLAGLAMARGSKDNISAIVVVLNELA